MSIADFLIAVRFLTILPLGRGEIVPSGRMARAMAWFPAVGLLMGGALYALDRLLGAVLPGPVESIILVAFLALLTGGMHLDGLADTLDGAFGGRGDRTRALEIMKDSRIGAMGAVGLILLLTLKWAALTGITGHSRMAALVLMPTLARWSQAGMAYRAVSARGESSLATPFMDNLSAGHVILASTVTLAAAAVFAGAKGLIAFLIVAAFTGLARAHFNYRLGGVTGDTIGAVSEASEVIVFLAFMVMG